MAFRDLTAFGAGEITPELAERSNLDKFQTGLKTLRNGVITKFGGLKSRIGTLYVKTLGSAFEPKMYIAKNSQSIFMFGLTSVKISYYNAVTDTFVEDEKAYTTFTLTQEDLTNLHLDNDDELLVGCVEGKVLFKISRVFPGGDSWQSVFVFGAFIGGPAFTGTYNMGVVVTGSTGYQVDYLFTRVQDEYEEAVPQFTSLVIINNASVKLPISTGQYNTLKLTVPTATALPPATEARLYRRPAGSGAWAFIGLATPIVVGANYEYTVTDVGQDADLSNQPPDFIKGLKANETLATRPKTVSIYQNRMLVAARNNLYGSRTGMSVNKLLNSQPILFTRDFPLQDDSGVTFATGSSGGANISRMFDGRGLFLATTSGVYETPSDILKYDTAFAIKRSNIIHNDKLPVLGMAGSVFLNDLRLKGVFRLSPSDNIYDMKTNEVSIFSGHLFDDVQLTSWQIQDNGTQILWIVRSDGKFLSFSYQEDQQLQAWARHDILGCSVRSVDKMTVKSVGDFVFMTVKIDATYHLIRLAKTDLDVYRSIHTDLTKYYENRMVASDRWVEITAPVVVAGVLESGRFNYVGTLDRTVADNTARDAIPDTERYLGMIVKSGAVTYELKGGLFNINWAVYSGPFANTAGLGAVGSILRFFNAATGEHVDYRSTAYVNSYTIDMELAPGQDRDMFAVMGVATVVALQLTQMYQTFTVLTGLGHLEGLDVAIRADGFTEASPLNNIRDYPTYTVTGGQITLDDRAAIISVGLPIVTDIQTLDSQSMEQVSAKTESTIVNKLFVSYYKSRGLYVGSDFPADNTLTGLEDHEEFFEPDEGIEPYQPHKAYSRREEVVIQGDWKAASSTAFRNVDPQPIGIRAFLLDEEKIGE